MVHEVSRREVLNNLIRFKDNLLEMRGEEDRGFKEEEGEPEQDKKKGERSYKVLINRKTGDMRFTQRITALETHIARREKKKESPEDWKEIRIIVQQKNPHDLAHFEVRVDDNQSLKPSDVDPIAWRIASETVDVLNQKAREIKGTHLEMLAEEAVLADLSSIHLSPPKEMIEDLPGWAGSISRIEAEERLTGKPVGTYLIREGDEITLSIAFQFAEQNFLTVHPYLLTVVEDSGKIADVLLLQTSKGWTLYRDNPNLKDGDLYHYSPSPKALLQSLSQIARLPFPMS